MKQTLFRRAVWTSVLFLFLSAGCSLIGDDVRGEVTGEAEPPVLLLHNETNRTAHYFAFDKGGMALIYITEPTPCGELPTIAAGETARVPYEDIAYYGGGVTASVKWCVPGTDAGGSFEVDLKP